MQQHADEVPGSLHSWAYTIEAVLVVDHCWHIRLRCFNPCLKLTFFVALQFPKALLFLCTSSDKSLHVFGQFEDNLFAFCCLASFGNIARLKFFDGFCGCFADVSCRILRHARSFKGHISIATTDEPPLPQVAWALKLLDTAQRRR